MTAYCHRMATDGRRWPPTAFGWPLIAVLSCHGQCASCAEQPPLGAALGLALGLALDDVGAGAGGPTSAQHGPEKERRALGEGAQHGDASARRAGWIPSWRRDRETAAASSATAGSAGGGSKVKEKEKAQAKERAAFLKDDRWKRHVGEAKDAKAKEAKAKEQAGSGQGESARRPEKLKEGLERTPRTPALALPGAHHDVWEPTAPRTPPATTRPAASTTCFGVNVGQMCLICEGGRVRFSMRGPLAPRPLAKVPISTPDTLSHALGGH